MTFFHLKLPICTYCAQSSVSENRSKNLSNYLSRVLCLLNKASFEEKCLKFSKDQKKVFILHNEMLCIINSLSFLVATSEKHNFFFISKSMFLVFPQHTSCRALF